MPSYSAPDNAGSLTIPYTQLDPSKPASMDSNYGSSGFMKRSETAKNPESVDAPAASENSFSA